MSLLAQARAQSSKAKVEKARKSLHNALGRTETHRNKAVSRLEAIAKAAELKRADLQKQLPTLAAKAEGATDERSAAHGAYLQAVQNMRQCDQVYSGAKRELIVARNF